MMVIMSPVSLSVIMLTAGGMSMRDLLSFIFIVISPAWPTPSIFSTMIVSARSAPRQRKDAANGRRRSFILLSTEKVRGLTNAKAGCLPAPGGWHSRLYNDNDNDAAQSKSGRSGQQDENDGGTESGYQPDELLRRRRFLERTDSNRVAAERQDGKSPQVEVPRHERSRRRAERKHRGADYD